MTTQSGERERRDIDPGKGGGACAEGVDDRRSDNRGVRDASVALSRAVIARARRGSARSGLRPTRRHAAPMQDRRARRRSRPARAPRPPSRRARASGHSRSPSAPSRLRRRNPALAPSRALRAPGRTAPEHRGAARPLNACRAPTAEASSGSSSGNRAARVAAEAPCASRLRRAVMGPARARPRLSRRLAAGAASLARNHVRPRPRSRARAPSTGSPARRAKPCGTATARRPGSLLELR